MIDRYLPTARPFDTNLRDMIEESDLVLVLLTKNSITSPWVNQEIGYATARGKTIWPLAMEKDIEPEGMISTTQSYSLFDWSDPAQTLDKLIRALQADLRGKGSRYREFGLDHVLTGKLQRTEFVVERLHDLLSQKNRETIIYHQAAFSIFAASDDPMYKEAGGHTDEYMRLLLEERKALNDLVTRPNTQLRLILWPVRAYEERYLAIRYKNLIEWLREVRNDKSIQIACAQYPGSNRLIVLDDFILEGYKLSQKSGYEMSVVRYQPSKIETGVNEFELFWKQLTPSTNLAIEKINKMYEKVSSL